MLGYFNDSPYVTEKGISGTEALREHLRHRQELELHICREVFSDRYILLQSTYFNSCAGQIKTEKKLYK